MNHPRPSSSLKEEAPYLLACCTVFFLCIVIAHPFANNSFIDDWSYAYVASQFAQTGRFHYSGWGSPSIVLQSIWASIWIRIFGFSFDLLRLVSVPFSLAFILLIYALGRKVGLARNFALFGSLVVAASPLFFPVACSFMTEPYACSLTLLCIYAALCCADTPNPARARIWLWIFTAAAILGGSDRQTVWVAPIVLIPYLVWKKRSDRGFLVSGVVAYAACLAALAVVMKYFSPSYAPTALSHQQLLHLVLTQSFGAVRRIASLFLVALWMSLPAFLCSTNLWKRLTARQLAAILLISTAFFGLLLIGTRGIAPFVGNILTENGILSAGTEGFGLKPVLLVKPLQYGLTIMLVLVVVTWACLIWRKNPLMGLSANAAAVFLLFVCAYTPLLYPAGLTSFVFDRYALPLIPLIVISALLSAQPMVKNISLAAYLWFFVAASYAILTTHDYFATLRARASAAEELEKRGIPPDRMSIGFEHDGYTELQLAGHIGTIMYGVDYGKEKFWFWYFTPAMRKDYVAVSLPWNEPVRNPILQIPYTTWTYPFHHRIVIVKQPDIPRAAIPLYPALPNASH